MPNFAGLETKKNQLIRKALSGSLFLAPYSATGIGASITTTAAATLLALPTGWLDGGLLTDDGMQIARAVDKSEITSFGRLEASREDFTSDSETIQITLQETSKLTIALYTGAALSSLVPDTTSGELSIAKPQTPSKRTWRTMAMAVDNTDAGEIYVAKYFPRCTVTDYAEQAMAKNDEAFGWGVTLGSKFDDVAGFSAKTFFGGPGWRALLVDMGFPAATP